MAEKLLETQNVSKIFRIGGMLMGKKLVANDDISLSIDAGKPVILSIVGESGCGKSTLCKMILRLYRPDMGDIKLNGKSIANKTPRQSIKNGFAMLTEERRATGIFPYANILFNTVISNLGSYKKGPLLSDKKMTADTDWSISSMHIKTPSQ